MNIYLYTNICIHIKMYMFTDLLSYISIYITCLHICIHRYMYTNMYLHTYMHLYIYTQLHTCTYTSTFGRRDHNIGKSVETPYRTLTGLERKLGPPAGPPRYRPEAGQPWARWGRLGQSVSRQFKGTLTLRLQTAQKPYIIWSLGPKAVKYESSEP